MTGIKPKKTEPFTINDSPDQIAPRVIQISTAAKNSSKTRSMVVTNSSWKFDPKNNKIQNNIHYIKPQETLQ